MTSADEVARHALWLEQRDRRIAKRQELEAAFAGDPVAAAEVRAGFQPLLNCADDLRNPVPDDEPESRVVANHNLNL